MGVEIMETLILKEPVEITLKRAGGEERTETITELNILKFKAKFLRCLDGLGADAQGSQLLALIARMTGQPVKVIDELGAEDLDVIGGKVESFLPNGQKTGRTPSAT